MEIVGSRQSQSFPIYFKYEENIVVSTKQAFVFANVSKNTFEDSIMYNIL